MSISNEINTTALENVTPTATPALGKQIVSFFSQRIVYHSLLWMIYISLMLIVNSASQGFWFTLVNVLIHTFFLGTLVYFNLYWLLPKYLSQKKFITYFALLFLSTLIATPLEVFCLYHNMAAYPAAQESILQNQLSHLIFMFIVLNIGTVSTIVKEWLTQQRTQRDLEKRNLQSELSFLKSQINPHFLFNTLNSLYALTLKKSDQAPEIVLRLSEMMRYMLYECNNKVVPLDREIQYIQNYLALERIRYGTNARIEFQYIGEEAKNYQVAPLLFIPFLENAFKHGLGHQLSGGFVEILLSVEDDNIDFFIQNSKSEKKTALYYKGGIGLKNIKRRLELIYPNDYDLSMNDMDESYSVNLQINIKPTH